MEKEVGDQGTKQMCKDAQGGIYNAIRGCTRVLCEKKLSWNVDTVIRDWETHV